MVTAPSLSAVPVDGVPRCCRGVPVDTCCTETDAPPSTTDDTTLLSGARTTPVTAPCRTPRALRVTVQTVVPPGQTAIPVWAVPPESTQDTVVAEGPRSASA